MSSELELYLTRFLTDPSRQSSSTRTTSVLPSKMFPPRLQSTSSSSPGDGSAWYRRSNHQTGNSCMTDKNAFLFIILTGICWAIFWSQQQMLPRNKVYPTVTGRICFWLRCNRSYQVVKTLVTLLLSSLYLMESNKDSNAWKIQHQLNMSGRDQKSFIIIKYQSENTPLSELGISCLKTPKMISTNLPIMSTSIRLISKANILIIFQCIRNIN